MGRKRKDWVPKRCEICAVDKKNNNRKRLKLFETAKQWRDHRRGVHKLLTNDTVYEDLVANYVTKPEPTPTPEFQLVPDVLDSDLADILN